MGDGLSYQVSFLIGQKNLAVILNPAIASWC